VAETIEARWADDLGPRVGELAWHYARAVTTQDIGKAISYAKAAGDRSLAQLAPGDALRWYRQALDLLDEQPDEQMTARILVRVGDAQRQTGDPSFRETLLTAGRLAAEHDDTPSLIEAALANNRGIQSATGRVDEDRVQAIEAALSAVGADDTADRARLLSLLALERTFDGDYDGRRAIADEALAMAERLGDKATLLDVLHRRHQPIWIPDTLPDRLLDTARGDELATALGDPIGLFWSAMLRKSDALEAGDLAEVSRCLDVVAAVAADVGQPTLAWTSAFSEAWRILLTGDATRAEAQADEALRLGNETGQPDALTIYLGQVAAVRWHQGRTDELVDAVATVAVDNPGLPAVRALYAHMAVDAGREDEARKLLSAEVSAGFPHPRDLLLLCNLSYWAEVAARLADPVAAEMLYERLTPWPAHVGFTGATVVGAAAHYLGMLAAVLGPHEAADVHFTQALEIHRGLGAPFHLARTHVEWGRALLADGQVDAARTNLEAARGLAAQHGCGLVLLRADALLEATAGPT
jgi:tetratricopeptide (TPR) repeat protein